MYFLLQKLPKHLVVSTVRYIIGLYRPPTDKIRSYKHLEKLRVPSINFWVFLHTCWVE